MDVRHILEIGQSCTAEENAPCVAACPLQVDVRTMLQHVRDGNWDSAWKRYSKQTVFPSILAHICDAPCRNACVRSEIDDALELQLLELAIFDFATKKKPRRFAAPLQKKSVAVVGAGLTGMTAAVLLSASGYRVDLYESQPRIGGRLWETDASELPRDVLQAQLDDIAQDRNITIHCDTPIRAVANCRADAVLLSNGSSAQAHLIAAGDQAGYDTEFWACQMEKGVFYAGLGAGDDGLSPAAAIAAGKQYAQRIDWYVRGMKTPAAQPQHTDTRLKPDIRAATVQSTVRPGDSNRYTLDEAQCEAGRCLDCHCLHCVESCELLKQNHAYPKKYINDVYQSLNLVEKFSESICKRQIYSCSLCGQCQTVCPESIDMGSVYLQARRTLYEKGSLPPAFHEFFLNDMLFSNGEAALTLPGKNGSQYAFFPGCRLGGLLPNTLEATYRFLSEKLTDQVALMLGCCGAPAYWAGREDLRTQATALIRHNWQELGRPTLILGCPSCAKMLRAFAPEIPQKMIWAVFQTIGIPEPTTALSGGTFSVFDPCSAADDPALRQDVRRLLQQCHTTLIPLKESGGCCGYGGLIAYANPLLLDQVVQRRIRQSPAEYVTYCVNCRDTFVRRGKSARHLLELIFQTAERERTPSLTRQRDNRRRLVLSLQNLPIPDDNKIPLLADEHVIARMDRQFILMEQVYQVIQHSEQTGCYIVNKSTNTILGKYQQGATTYWVEYERLASGYRVLDTYSHHMEIIDDVCEQDAH